MNAYHSSAPLYTPESFPWLAKWSWRCFLVALGIHALCMIYFLVLFYWDDLFFCPAIAPYLLLPPFLMALVGQVFLFPAVIFYLTLIYRCWMKRKFPLNHSL